MNSQFCLELHKIRSCWPTKLIYNIPLYEMMLSKNLINSKYKNTINNSIEIDKDLLDFIFNLVDLENLSLETAEATIIILQYYMKNSKNPNKYNIQLITMVSIFLCSKMFDVNHFSLSHFHKISEHKYNNKIIFKCEEDILKTIDYDLFLRDNTIINKIYLYLETVRDYFEEKDFLTLKETTEQFLQLIYLDMKIIKNYDLDFISVSIIQAAFMMCTMEEGKTPLLFKLSLLSDIKEDNICLLAKKIVKISLGSDVYKMFNF